MNSEKIFFGLAVLLVIGMAAFMLYDSGKQQELGAGMNVDDSIPINTGTSTPTPSAGLQVISIKATPYGYDNDKLTVKAGTPVRLDFSADPRSGCGRQLIVDKVGVNLISRNGETVSATFTAPTPGVYKFHCAMNMFRGELTAT